MMITQMTQMIGFTRSRPLSLFLSAAIVDTSSDAQTTLYAVGSWAGNAANVAHVSREAKCQKRGK